jgi:hypothetical protein
METDQIAGIGGELLNHNLLLHIDSRVQVNEEHERDSM